MPAPKPARQVRYRVMSGDRVLFTCQEFANATLLADGTGIKTRIVTVRV